MQEKYPKFMLGNKIIHGSYDMHYLHNNNNVNNIAINNTIFISDKKRLDKKGPFKFNNIINTPSNMLIDKNIYNIIYFIE